MGEIIHRPVRSGAVGKVDSWGFGSRGVLWDYPTLGISRVCLTTSVGGVSYPLIEGVRATFNKPYYAPLQEWGVYAPTWALPDGRKFIAHLIDGEKCIVELLP